MGFWWYMTKAGKKQLKQLNRGLTMDCYKYASGLAKKHGGEMLHLKPKSGFPTGRLPGDPTRGQYQYHSFMLKDGKLYDEFHKKGIDLKEWKRQYMDLNNLRNDREFDAFAELDGIPHPNAIPRRRR